MNTRESGSDLSSLRLCSPVGRWTALLLLAATVGALRAPAASCDPPPSGLVGWWPGDGNANDIQGTNNGVLQGGASASAPGIVGSAFSFDGTNGYVQIPDAPELRPTNLTIEGWVRFNSLDSAGSGGSTAGQQYIVFKQNTRTNSFEGFSLIKDRSGSTNFFVFGVSSASGQAPELHSATTIQTSVWYHVAAVRDVGSIQLYVNGYLERQTNVAFAQDYGNYPLYFGSTGESYWDHKLNGWLDEVSLYSRALSSNEIAAIYAAGAYGKCKGVSVITQPQSQTVVAGSNAMFTVASQGRPPLGYQWQFNGANLAGATDTSLTLTAVQPTNAGNYTVVVTNATASVTSAVAVLTVLVPPTFTTQPQNTTNDPGTVAAFSAVADGSLPLSYQWQHNGAALTNDARIGGATTASLQIANVQASDAGNYALVASNAAGVATSPVASLTVTGPPGIAAQPASQIVAVGASVSFTVVASGTLPLVYQWQRNGANLADGGNVSGATGSVLTLTQVQTNDAATYQVVINNGSGAITSAVASLTVNFAPFVTLQPASQAAVTGTNVLFTVAVSGALPLGYQWQFNGANLADGGQVNGAASSALALSTVVPANAGGYSVVVTNYLGAATSAVATLTVTPPTGCIAPLPGLVGWWPGDGSARDIVGTNNGILEGNAIATAPGLTGEAFSFDGTNGYVQIPDAPEFHPTNLTVEVWVKFDAYQTPGDTYYSNQQYMVFKQNSRSSEFEGFALTKDHDPQGDVFLWEVASSAGELIRIDSVNTVVTGAWYHAVGVRGSNYTQLYMNGHLEVQTNVDFPQDYGTFPLYFGTSGQSYYDRRLHGELDEVRLYNRALSSNEITALYLAGSAGACKGTNGLQLTSQPQSQSVEVGGSAGFSVGTTGAAPVSYQWQFNGVPIAGATSSNLALVNLQLTNGGSYNVVVSNPSGSKVSATGILTVLVPPGISVQPSNQVVLAGADVNFSVGANGSPPLVYQWMFNGSNVDGAVSSALSLTDVQPAQAGGYSVLVTNAAGPLTSTVAILTVLVLPSISLQPSNQTVVAGANVQFISAADGSAPLAYQWLHDGASLDGATADTLSLADVQPAQAGDYSVVVANSAGAATSTVAMLTVLVPPTVTLQPASQTVLAGTNVDFVAGANGTVPLAYQWQFDGANLDGAVGQTLDLVNVQPAEAGDYRVVVSNRAGAVTSTVATLTVLVPPSISLQPSNQTVVAGADVDFSVTANGSAPLSYQWQFNSTNLEEAVAETLSLTNVQPDQAGSYNVVVSNGAGAVTSLVATLVVLVPPSIVVAPTNQAVMVGSNVNFSVTAMGTAPLSYQWQFNGTNLDGASAETLSLLGVQPAQAGSYSVRVSNEAGTTNTPGALLTVLRQPALLDPQILTNGLISFSLSGDAGQTYSIEYCSELSGSNSWIALTNVTLVGSAAVWSDPQPATASQRFYRAVWEPVPPP